MKRVFREDGKYYVRQLFNSKGQCVGHLGTEIKGDRAPEMSINSSKLLTDPSGGCTVVFTDLEGEIVGNGFRYGNHLHTNRHVGENSVGWHKPGTRGRFRLDKMHGLLAYDYVYYRVKAVDFATAGVKAIRRTTKLRPNASVQVRGYCPGSANCYVQSRGNAGDEVGRGMAAHTMSTRPGMSGSPVFAEGELVGIHSGAQPGSGVNYMFVFEIARSIFSSQYYAKLGLVHSVPETLRDDDDEYYAEEVRKQTQRNRKLARAFGGDDFAILEEEAGYDEYIYARDNGFLEEDGIVDYDDFLEFVDTGTMRSHGSSTVMKA